MTKNFLFTGFMFLVVFAMPATLRAGDDPDVSPLEEYLRQARQGAGARVQQGASLFSVASPSLFLYDDFKARRINDIVTIQIIESSSASNSANTSTESDGNSSASAPSFFGLERAGGTLNFANLLQGLSDMSFSGAGTTTRAGSLTASLSARVVEVLANGDLVLEGVKEVAVNRERHLLTLRGVVRPRDVSSGNMVLSTAIAHMEVKFDGNGIVTDANKPGFFYRLFRIITPF